MGISGSSASVNLMTQALLDWEGGRSAERIGTINPSDDSSGARQGERGGGPTSKEDQKLHFTGQNGMGMAGGVVVDIKTPGRPVNPVSMNSPTPRLLDRTSAGGIFAHTTEGSSTPSRAIGTPKQLATHVSAGPEQPPSKTESIDMHGGFVQSANAFLSDMKSPARMSRMKDKFHRTDAIVSMADILPVEGSTSHPAHLPTPSHSQNHNHHSRHLPGYHHHNHHHSNHHGSSALLENPAAVAFRQNSDLSAVSLMSDSTAVMLEDHQSSTSGGVGKGLKSSEELMGVRSISSISLDPQFDDSIGAQSSSHSIQGAAAAAAAAAAAVAASPSGPAQHKHKRERNKTHTPRPSNSFILYRREKHAEIMSQYKGAKALNNNVISKIVATMWRQEEPEVKAKYAAKAEEEKKAHMLKYPDYKYRPRKSPQKVGAKGAMQKPGPINQMPGVVPVSLGMGMGGDGTNAGYPSRQMLLSPATHYSQPPLHPYQPSVDMSAAAAWTSPYDPRYHQLQHHSLYNASLHAQQIDQMPSMQLYGGGYDSLVPEDIQLMNPFFSHSNPSNPQGNPFHSQYPHHGHQQQHDHSQHQTDFSATSALSTPSPQRSNVHAFSNNADLTAAAMAAATNVHVQSQISQQHHLQQQQQQHTQQQQQQHQAHHLSSQTSSTFNPLHHPPMHGSVSQPHNPYSHQQRLQHSHHGDPTIALPADPASSSSSSSSSSHGGRMGRRACSPDVGVIGSMGEESDVAATAAMAASYQYSPWVLIAHQHDPLPPLNPHLSTSQVLN
ncbi:hypothetical protein HDU67_004263 [Dinochytrium kinnereticum]|nr:hypothetical protein HDU67_004263 [Dinochytrium kinnereticum]